MERYVERDIINIIKERKVKAAGLIGGGSIGALASSNGYQGLQPPQRIRVVGAILLALLLIMGLLLLLMLLILLRLRLLLLRRRWRLLVVMDLWLSLLLSLLPRRKSSKACEVGMNHSIDMRISRISCRDSLIPAVSLAFSDRS